MGATLHHLGRLDEAEASYRQAIEINSHSLKTLHNLARLLIAQCRVSMALTIVKKSLQIKETGEAKKLFVDCAKRLRWTHQDSETQIALIRALTEPWDRPGYLAQISADLLKVSPHVANALAVSFH